MSYNLPCGNYLARNIVAPQLTASFVAAAPSQFSWGRHANQKSPYCMLSYSPEDPPPFPDRPPPNDRADGRCSRRQNVKRLLA